MAGKANEDGVIPELRSRSYTIYVEFRPDDEKKIELEELIEESYTEEEAHAMINSYTNCGS